MNDAAPLVVVSSATRIGPLVREQLREHCPARPRTAFDEFAPSGAWT